MDVHMQPDGDGSSSSSASPTTTRSPSPSLNSRPEADPPESSSTITHDPIPGRSVIATFTWYLFRLLAPHFIPPIIHHKGPQRFPFPPPIPPSSSCVAEEWEYEGWTMVSVRPRREEEARQTSRAMMYLHGGAFHHSVNKQHWRIAARFAEDLDAEVVLVPTPLAPANSALEVIPKLVRVYSEFARRSGERELIIAGDSSGGNLALVVALEAAAQDLPVPQQLILLSPWLDPSCTNPTMFTTAPLDPILRIPRIRPKGHGWAQGTASLPPDELERRLADPLINLLNANLAPLVAAQTQVIITSGTYDILHPDVELFVKKAESAGASVHYIEAKGQVHVFPMYGGIIPEGRIALEKIATAVKGYYGGERWASHSSVESAEERGA